MDRTIEFEITKVVRLRNSKSGNPRWELHTDTAYYFTEPDSALGCQVSYDYAGRTATVTLNGHNRITALTVIDRKESDND